MRDFIFAVACFGLVVGLSASAVPSDNGSTQRFLSETLVQNLNQEIQRLNFSNIPDPLILEDFSIVFKTLKNIEELFAFPIPSIDLGLDIDLNGNVSVCNNPTITGLSLTEFSVSPKIVSHVLTEVLLGIYTETLTFTGDDNMFITYTQGGNAPKDVRGEGSFDIEMIGAKFMALFNVNINDQEFDISDLDLHFGFDCFALNMIGTTVDNVEPNWQQFSTEFKKAVDTFWSDIKPTLERLLQGFINYAVGKCDLSELLAGNFDCLRGLPSKRRDEFLSQLAEHFKSNSALTPTCPVNVPQIPTQPEAICDMSEFIDDVPTHEPSGSYASAVQFNFTFAFILFLYTVFSKKFLLF